jgi:mRNA interferase MazF
MRGQVYRVTISEEYGPKPYVVVSNNVRNRKLNSVLAVRVTTTDKAHIPTAVPLQPGDPQVGYALADDIVEIYQEEWEAGTYLGALLPQTILALNTALKQALAIP